MTTRHRVASLLFAAGLVASLVVTTPSPADAASGAPKITMTPSLLAQPRRLTLGPDGNIWFTDANGNGVGMLGFVKPTTGAITRFATPAQSNQPFALTVGPDGYIWFTQSSRNRLGRVKPSTKKVTEFVLPAGATGAYGITVGSDGALWFVEAGSGRIGRIDPQTFVITDFPDTGSSNPGDIVGGPDGAVWFNDQQGLSRMDVVTHAVTHFPRNSYIARLALGADHNIWIADQSSNAIVRFTIATSSFTAIPLASYARLNDLVAAPNGDIWFAEGEQAKIGRVNSTTLALTEFPVGNETRPVLLSLAIGSDSRVWFGDEAGLQFGVMPASGAPVTLYPPVVPRGANNAIVGPDQAMWFTDLGENFSPYYDHPDRVLRLDPRTKKITAYPAPNPDGHINDLVVGPDHRIWFTEQYGSAVGVLDPTTGSTAEVPLPNPNSYPVGITTGPDGLIWVAEAGRGAIASIDPTSHAVVEYLLPGTPSSPSDIVDGHDGGLWLADTTAARIARFDLGNHQFTTVPVAAFGNGGYELAIGTNHTVWWANAGGNGSISSIDQSTLKVTTYALGQNNGAYGLALGSDNAMWFTGFRLSPFGPAIGRLDPATGAVSWFPFKSVLTNSSPGGLASGPTAGQLWFGDGLQIGNVRLTQPTS